MLMESHPLFNAIILLLLPVLCLCIFTFFPVAVEVGWGGVVDLVVVVVAGVNAAIDLPVQS